MLKYEAGPGKFEGCGAVGFVCWHAAGDGWCDDETGSVSENGVWYGRRDGPFTGGHLHDLDIDPRSIPEHEREDLATAAGFVVSENDYGFVDAVAYRNRDALDHAWDECEAEVAEWHEESVAYGEPA